MPLATPPSPLRATSEPGVYVAPALLAQLERDKRSLKWQLSQATASADARAAQLAACEAKVKDLMTIVEMNKSVADRAVQRNYTKECVLQRLHRERVELQTCVEIQRRRGLMAFARRRMLDTKRGLFQAWASASLAQKRRRMAITRMLRSRRRRWLCESWQRWQRQANIPAVAEVHPLHVAPRQELSVKSTVRFAVPSSPSPSQTGSVLSESSSSAGSLPRPWQSSQVSHSANSHKTLSFATWKAHWLARRRRHTTAIHFARLLLAKRVLSAWKQVIRRRNWQLAMVQSAQQQRLRHLVTWWHGCATRRRKARFLLAKLATRAMRRWLQAAWTTLRIKSLEKCMVEWSTVLKAAREAMDEERKIYALHQSDAMHDLQQLTTRQQQRQELFIDAQLRALEKKRRLNVLRFSLAKWQRGVAFRALQWRMATQFRRFRGLRSLTRRMFTVWRVRATQQRGLQRKLAQNVRNAQTALLKRVFLAFTTETKRFSAQKRALRRLWIRKSCFAMVRALYKWQSAMVVANEQASALLQQRELANRLAIRESAWQGERQRLRRVTHRYQLQCALTLGDAKRETCKRNVFTAWKVRVLVMHKRRATLKKLLTRKVIQYQRLALSAWHLRSQHHVIHNEELLKIHQRRQRHTLRAVLCAWRAATQQQLLASTRHGLQFVSLLLLQKRCGQQRARSAALRLVIKLHLRFYWQRPAFATWRQKCEVAKLLARRHQEACQELLTRLWRRWTQRVARLGRQRRSQIEQFASKAESQREATLVRGVWALWRAAVRQRRLTATSSALLRRSHSRAAQMELLPRVWLTWRRHHQRHSQRRMALQRLSMKMRQHAVASAWRRWRATVDIQCGMRLGGMAARRQWQHTLTWHATQRLARSLLTNWRQITRHAKSMRLQQLRFVARRQRATLVKRLQQWRQCVVYCMRVRRGLLRILIEQKRKAMLQLGVRLWQRGTMAWSRERTRQHVMRTHSRTQERAMVWLRKAWMARGLRMWFTAWQSHASRCQRQRQLIRGVVKNYERRQFQYAWSVWSQLRHRFVALQCMESTLRCGILRHVWQHVRGNVAMWHAQKMAIRQFVAVFSKALLRNTWNQWKRRDRWQLGVRLSSTQSSVSATLQAFMDRIGHRQFTRALLVRVFTQWRKQAQYQHLLRRRVVDTLAKSDARHVQRCFRAWASYLSTKSYTQHIVLRLVTRKAVHLQRQGFGQWKAFTLTSSYESQLRQTRVALQQQRETLARHVAMAMFTRWQKPTLHAVLRGWRAVVEAKVHKTQQAIDRNNMRRLRMAWHVWQAERRRVASARKVLDKLLRRQQRRCVAVAWQVWQTWLWRVTAMADTLDRVFHSIQMRLLKMAWQSLRVHQDVAMRRQSMMVVVAAQSQLKQHKQCHTIRKVTFALQQRSKTTARQLFSAWKSYVATHRLQNVVKKTATRRYLRRIMRSTLREWRGVMRRRQRIEKWQLTVCQPRLVRRMWQSWQSYLTKRHQATQFLWELLETQRQQALANAWHRWREIIENQTREQETQEIIKWRRATMAQQSHVSSLENKTELLLLESVELKRALHTQRVRCAQAFAMKLGSVMETMWQRQICDVWGRWTELVDRARAAQWLVNKMATWHMRNVFTQWKRDLQHYKWTQHETQILDKMALILSGSSTLTRKKSAWRDWKVYTQQRKQQRVVATLRCRGRAQLLKRSSFDSWKRALRESSWRRAQAHQLANQRTIKLVRQTLLMWWRWLERAKARREGVLMLLRIHRAMARRCVMRHWLTWRTHTAESTIVLAKTRVVLMELAEMERTAQSDTHGQLMRVLTAWREATKQWRQRRKYHSRVMVRQRQCQQQRAIVRRVLWEWRAVVATQRAAQIRKLQPVLCIRSPLSTGLKKRKTATLHAADTLCSFEDYTQRRLSHGGSSWRGQLLKRIKQRRVRHVLGTAWLVRCLRRHHQRLLRRAFWRWFAMIQEISSALQMIDFRGTLPWRRPNVDYGSSMLLLVLEEMDLARQIHRHELTQRAWCVVNTIATSQQRQALRRGFDKWRWANYPRTRLLRSHGVHHNGYTTVPTAASNTLPSTAAAINSTSIRMARARACVAHLVRVQLRRGFAAWKAQYVALALQHAQAEQLALLRALAQTTAYRQTMDVQAM